MNALPRGTVTFLFTDVEGSTRLLQELGDGYADVLAEHRRALRGAFARHGGVEVDTQGDAFFVAFAKASDALAAALDARAALAGGPIRARIGVHTGEPVVSDEGYVGIDIHRAARIAAVGHGGQILVSQSTRDLAGDGSLRDLGEHRLKDLAATERIYQLGDGDFPPLKSLNNSNLPLPAEPLIGRKKELADVLLVLRDGVRLVTVTGPGGIGKTRFALEVAAELIEQFRDGVWWVGLAPVRDARLVVPTIATAVGAKDELRNELRGKELLLLLDNLEHVVAVAADLAAIQRACPGVALLTTSREPLHIAGEREYPLSPLAESPAVELFRQRAEAVVPEFDADYRALAQVCDRLDRLPLAIELAAARTKLVPTEELLKRLEQRLPLLTSRRRDVDERQRTLRATIEWSYDLLDAHEKESFACLSVFAGGFDADAAHVVCGADLDSLESLVDKSLVRRAEEGRYFMLETIREYATERLDGSRSAGELRTRHADWIRALAVEAKDALRDERQFDFFARLTREHGNIRAALTFAVETQSADRAVAISACLGRFWVLRGHDREGHRWLDQALALDRSKRDEFLYRALYWNSVLASGLGKVERASTLADDALAVARELGDDESVAAASLEVVRRACDVGDFRRAESTLADAIVATDRPGMEFARAMLVMTRGQFDLAGGELDAATSSLEAAARLVGQRADRHVYGSAMSFLALAYARRDKAPEARAALREALVLQAKFRFPYGVGVCLQVAAELAVRAGDGATAAQLLRCAVGLFDSFSSPPTGVESVLFEQTMVAVRAAVDDEIWTLAAPDHEPALDEAISAVERALD